MNVIGLVKKGEYFDSITIMLIARTLAASPGIDDAAVVMGTKENRSVLRSTGLSTPETEAAGDTDLVVAVRIGEGTGTAAVLKTIDDLFASTRKKPGSAGFRPSGLEAAVEALPGANLAMISVAGRFACDLAMRALQNGLHVFLFSDNVPIDQELSLKRYAREHGLLVMGPDCGTAIINGIPLAFANVVNRGSIGIVAASGTGLQEVSCFISNAGAGISQAIGTGGRDVKKSIGGISFLQGIRALADDPATKTILLVSKPPDREVMRVIASETSTIGKPVAGVFLGATPEILDGSGIISAPTLESGAAVACALAAGSSPDSVTVSLNRRSEQIRSRAAEIAAGLRPEQRFLRGLFSGGTFCDETQLLARGILRGIHSNSPVGDAVKLPDIWKSTGHTIVDLGDDEFTVGRPHPMIDYTTRCRRIIAEAGDPSTAVILLDIVLGYGSNPDPLAEILPAIGEATRIARTAGRKLPIAASVTGTDRDPQNRSAVAAALRNAGVIVEESNAAASLLAIHIAAKEVAS